ncbi:GNAT family N-acetyltransferase [Methylobacterium brachythecii]|uniref:CelD/BcsL family acetyltransferase involved in cellulose biosynthesis n=1 Tax=Methylobacterium brachythecii TaxID=1176177 RepID=A0A7W6F8M8_9HYPH|nr:GNAT family N-acetyltransferase [Methylobacterium brachythecii]MBB3904609.1 CelD/BcsL family acetyltransferase involved in cellulose biosynthesis [Methylobacterium brachythecii]GLS45045.1 hypothetical protein GCM10007884_30340 [Methylobacterium brachythecii]
MAHAARTAEGLVVAALPLDAASPLLPAWRELARDPLVENLFFEAEFALAAADAFGGGIRLLTVSDQPPEAPGARLLALWPCRVVRRWGVPIPALMGWTHGFSIFGPPLLARDEAAPALRALFDAPGHLGLPRRLLMPYLPLDGPFATLLNDTLARTGSRRADFWAHERGFLDPAAGRGGTRDAYLGAQLSERKARQLGRLFRRISAEAQAEHEIIRDPNGLAEALDDYVALESAGWKGRAGTAVAKRPREAAFLAGLVRSYGAGGRMRIDRLRRGGRSLAVSLSLETGSTFWFLKIAHDETEAKNSPGALLVERVTRSLLADPRIIEADSCAPPNFSLIETFWGERRRLAHGLIEASGGDPLFRPAVALEGLRAQAVRVRTSRSKP